MAANPGEEAGEASGELAESDAEELDASDSGLLDPETDEDSLKRKKRRAKG